MEPNKFDNKVKEKLEGRVLEPSTNAWNTLSERLNNESEEPRKKNYLWLDLAASLVGVLLLITQFGVIDSDTDIVNETPEVVEMPKNDLNIDNNVEKGLPEVKSDEYYNIDNNDIKESLNDKSSNKVARDFLSEEGVSGSNEFDISEIEQSDRKMTYEEQKILDVVAQVQLLKEENTGVTEEDIDALLLKAQNEIALNRLSQETGGTVDANALLISVEQELDQSFRSRVLQAIKASYNSVKTTIAQRNK